MSFYITAAEEIAHRESSENLVNRIHTTKLYPGHNSPGPNFPDFVKVMAGTLSHIDTGRNVAKAFGMTPQTVSDIKTGRGKGNTEIQKRIDENLGVVRDKAADLLLESLGFVTNDKMQKAKLTEVTAVARDMATIIEKTTPMKERGNGVVVQILSVDQHKDESVYNTIEVGISNDPSKV